MPSPALMRSFKLLFERYPLVAVFIYLFLSIIGIYIFVDTASDYYYYSTEKPLEVGIEGISSLRIRGRAPMVNISGIKWQCAEELNTESDKLIPITGTSEKNKNLVLFLPPTDFSGCTSHQYETTVKGTLSPIKTRYFKYLQSIEFQAIESYDQWKVWTLCGGCSAEDSLIGVYFSGAFSLIVIGALVLFTRKYFSAGK